MKWLGFEDKYLFEMRRRRILVRRRLLLAVVLVGALMLGTAAGAVPIGSEELDGPQRGFSSAEGDVPSTTIPLGAVDIPARFDAAAAKAQEQADAENARQGPEVPVGVSLPSVPNGIEPLEKETQGLWPRLSPDLDLDGSAALAAGGYQSDRVWLSDYPNDVYNVDYYYWMRTPQMNESNKCDGSGASCFWFTMIWSQMDCCNAGFHIGPQRGSSIAGNAGANWRMNIDGYENGVHIGGQSTTNLPTGKWVRVRVWKIASGSSSSSWGVWALWSGTDRYLGSLTIDGSWLAWSTLAVEIFEQNNQCSTDFVGVYLDNPIYRSASQGLRSYAQGTANYEANCSNTSWSVISDDFIHDGREVSRTVAEGENLWP